MWPARLDYEEGDVVPPGYDLKSRPSRGLFTGGLVTFLVPYGISFLVGGFNAVDGNDRDVDDLRCSLAVDEPIDDVAHDRLNLGRVINAEHASIGAQHADDAGVPSFVARLPQEPNDQ